MEEFNFMFGFYGLLLGFSVAAVTKGLATLLSLRRSLRPGLLTPLLGIFLLQDIATMWIFAWDTREHLSVNYIGIYGAIVVAMAYYFAATLAFPLRIGEGTDLDAHYWANKRFVLAALMLASGLTLVHAVRVEPDIFDWWGFWPLQAIYWLPLLALLFTRRKRLDTALLLFLVVGYLVEPLLELSAGMKT